MAHIKAIGIDRADLRHAVFTVAGRPKPFGAQQHPVFMDNKFDIAADCLSSDRIKRIIGHHIVLRRRGWRCQVVDQRD